MIECIVCGEKIDNDDVLGECPVCGQSGFSEGIYVCPGCENFIGPGGYEVECPNCGAASLNDQCPDDDEFECPNCGAAMSPGETICDDCLYMMDVNNYLD